MPRVVASEKMLVGELARNGQGDDIPGDRVLSRTWLTSIIATSQASGGCALVLCSVVVSVRETRSLKCDYRKCARRSWIRSDVEWFKDRKNLQKLPIVERRMC